MSKANDPTVRLPVPALNSAQLRAFAVPSQSPAPVPSASNQLAAEITQQVLAQQPLAQASQTVKLAERSVLALPDSLPSYLVHAQNASPTGVVSKRTARLILGDQIALGGMGAVTAARQVSLDRDVAVKSALAGAARNTSALLEEARIAGRLQHPNIVPVYDLGVDGDNRLILIMKRVEGDTWATRMEDRPDVDNSRWHDWLGAQLRVLLQICNALAFSHTCGIVHRDLKPVNIMIGKFGEVYVLDWGMAVEVRDEHGTARPWPVQEGLAEGTIAYMAPEQASVEPGGVTTLTDVFQLGALLYEILTGSAPFSRPQLADAVQAMCDCDLEPVAPPVSAEASTICAKAMARKPSDRYSSVMEFAGALEEYLQRRPAMGLCHAAERNLLDLRVAIARGATTDQLYAEFGQVRFGFQQALALWPGCSAAQTGLQSSILVVALHVLSQGDLHFAETLRGQLLFPDAGLDSALAEERARQAQKQADVESLQALARDHDSDRGAGSRRLLVWALAAVFPAMFGLAQAAVEMGLTQVSHFNLLWPGAVAIVVTAGVGHWRRAQMLSTAVNRTTLLVLLAMMVFAEVIRVAAALHGVPPTGVQLFDLGMYALAAAALSPQFGKRMLWASAAFAVAALVGAIWPRWLLALTGAAVGLSFWQADRLSVRRTQP